MEGRKEEKKGGRKGGGEGKKGGFLWAYFVPCALRAMECLPVNLSSVSSCTSQMNWLPKNWTDKEAQPCTRLDRD